MEDIMAITNAPQPTTGTTLAGFQKDFLFWLGETETKLRSIAEVFPDEIMDWRPSDKVKSVRELFLHVASGNYVFLQAIGKEFPTDYDVVLYERKCLSKDAVLVEIGRSFDEVRSAATGLQESDLAKEVRFLGQPMSVQRFLFILSLHQRHHLGQAVAYARINQLVPPGSQRETGVL
jgi:uncharacterized damage-inducible protein DinB